MGGSIEGCASERPVCYYNCSPLDNDQNGMGEGDVLSVEERNIELYFQCK